MSSTGKTVLVTGASGFVAASVLESFLSHGYHVRGTVRSESSAEGVREAHPKYVKQLSFSIVPDITVPGAFDEAVKGVDGVIHTASPFILDAKDYQRDLFDPAVKGTVSILESVQQHNPTVKRVVITSSFAAIIDVSKGARPGHTYSEADWNPITHAEALKADGSSAYCASKAFAEKAAFDFVRDKRPNFSIATVCPPMIYGPIVQQVTDMRKLNTSSADIYRLIDGSEKEVPPTGFPCFADVRDVAEAHRLAFEKEEAANQRYFITGGNFLYEDWCDIIHEKFPQLKDRTPTPKKGAKRPETFKVDNSKAKRELGLTFRSLEECVVDTVNDLLRLEKELGAKH